MDKLNELLNAGLKAVFTNSTVQSGLKAVCPNLQPYDAERDHVTIGGVVLGSVVLVAGMAIMQALIPDDPTTKR